MEISSSINIFFAITKNIKKIFLVFNLRNYITKKFSSLIEGAIAQSHRSFTKFCQKILNEGDILELDSGGAFFSGIESPFSQVIGWGFNEVDPNQLDEIENFYFSHKMPTCSIELSPFVGNGVLNILSKRSYLVKEWSQISYLFTPDYLPKPISNQICIKIIEEENELEEWGKIVAKGFGAENLSTIFSLYGKTEGIYPFGAWINGKLCGTATITIYNDIADLGVTSTLEEFRGKGIQKALLSKRLEFAKTKGVKIATVTTEPGSISDLNIQKIGFSPAYTRLGLVKDLGT